MKYNSEIIKKTRLEKGLTQSKLSELTGIDRKTLREYEKCRKEPHDKNAKLIAAALDINLEDLQYHIGSYQLTHEDFIQRVYDLVENEYTVLSKYNGMGEKILIRHNCDSCNNNEWEVRASSFVYDNTRCPICVKEETTPITAKLITKTHEEFLEKHLYH